MLNAVKSAAPLTPNQRVADAFEALPAKPAAGSLTVDQLKLSKPVAPRLDQVPAIKSVPGWVGKLATVGTIAGSMALLTASAFAISAGMGAAAPLVIGMAMLGNAALGLLGWGLLKQ